METNNITFWKLIGSNKISIPIIQRDYAQGREKEKEKREKFLNSILSHLESEEQMHLDFVYGREKENVFFPIDGQQRLTTLFLLHWYFALKENVDNEKKERLSKFVYDTRISSREFCQSLVREDIKIPASIDDNSFIKNIKNKHWYRVMWDTDPTIKAMLVMIQAIHNKFHYFSSYDVFERLTNSDLISFELLDLGKKGFELTDELYIKMNARGKQLTAFENFKANFIQLINKNFKDKKLEHPIKGKISYSGYFAYKIEKEWTDLFWAFRGDKKTTDEGFSNYFEFITQLFYFKDNKNAKAEDFKNSFNQYEEVYHVEENLLFLFDSLNALYKVFTKNDAKADSINIDDFYRNLFLTENIEGQANSRVRLFWNKLDEYNLFELIVKNNETDEVSNKRRNWIMQFCVLQHIVKFKKYEVDEQLINYARILRNLFQITRYKSDTKFINDIRLNYFGDYYHVFNKLNSRSPYDTLINEEIPFKGSRFTESTIKYEKEKAEILQSIEFNNEALLSIENMEDFGGLIHQLKPGLNQSKLQNYSKAIKEIWNNSISDTLRIQALIACGFDGARIKDTKMGETYYFGRVGNWDAILTSEDPLLSKSILSLIDIYNQSSKTSVVDKLVEIKNNWLAMNHTDRSYKYYFLKYPEFTSKLNYYVWPNNDYEIRMLGTEGSNPLVAYHISPFVLTVCRRINDKNVCDEDQCYLQYSGNSPLILKNGISLISKEEGWQIPKHSLLDSTIIEKYSLSTTNDFYILKDDNKKDRIEIAIDFINEIIK